jgi:hypothetical protein
VRWMERWAAYEQRKSDQRQARWQERQRQRARTGQTSLMDRWAAYEQRKADRQLAAGKELYRLRPQVPLDPVQGPGGSAIVIRVDQTGVWWLRWWREHHGPDGGVLSVLLLTSLLITEAIWWFVFHRRYTVHVRTNGHPPIKRSIRLPTEVAAYRAAARLVSQFQAEGPAALQSHWAEARAST